MGIEGSSVTTAFVALLGTMVTLVGTVCVFLLQQRQANRRPFLEEQLKLCFQATEAAARLASEVDAVEWEKARLCFWRLYWGPLSIVEDREVEGAMFAFGDLLREKPVSNPTLPMPDLEQPSLRLAHAARHLILTSWKIRLPELENKSEATTKPAQSAKGSPI
jgi:hypothetical protein